MSGRRFSRPTAALLSVFVGLALPGCATASAPASTSTTDPAVLATIHKVDGQAFQAAHPGRWVEVTTEPGMESVSVTNYDLGKPPPARQDVVGYGRLGSGPATFDKVVKHVSVIDGKKFYMADLDPASHQLLLEDGSWFLPEDKQAYIDRQLATLDALLTTAR